MKKGKYSKRGVTTKVMLIILALMLMIGATVGGTIAWLTAESDTVTNTFTVGSIEIDLWENEYDPDTNTLGKGEVETQDDYKIVPGATNPKNPTVTVVKGSEACWLYVTIENNLVLDGAAAGVIAAVVAAITGAAVVHTAVYVDVGTAVVGAADAVIPLGNFRIGVQYRDGDHQHNHTHSRHKSDEFILCGRLFCRFLRRGCGYGSRRLFNGDGRRSRGSGLHGRCIHGLHRGRGRGLHRGHHGRRSRHGCGCCFGQGSAASVAKGHGFLYGIAAGAAEFCHRFHLTVTR